MKVGREIEFGPGHLAKVVWVEPETKCFVLEWRGQYGLFTGDEEEFYFFSEEGEWFNSMEEALIKG